MALLAHKARNDYACSTSKLNLPFIKSIYKKERIRLDYRPIKSPRIRAMYFCDELGCSVMIKKDLPMEQKLFSLIHELKHHLVDQKNILSGKMICGDYTANEAIEKGAEVFAAEFIYPESAVCKEWKDFGLPRDCSAADIVRFMLHIKRPISYKTLTKRLGFCGLIDPSKFESVKFKKLQDELFPPFYKKPGFHSRRQKSFV
jgi:Zn-dependent peptidase ImmA (M78 family)